MERFNAQVLGKGAISLGKRIYSVSTPEFYFGEYHNLHPGSPPNLSPQQTSFNWFDYPAGNHYDANDYATDIGELRDNSKAEVASQLFIVRNIYSGGTFRAVWYRDRDKKVIFDFSVTIPDPSSQGWDYWSWYACWSWIGKFSGEMDEPGHYFVEVASSWGSIVHDFDFNAKYKCDGVCGIDPTGQYTDIDTCNRNCFPPTITPPPPTITPPPPTITPPPPTITPPPPVLTTITVTPSIVTINVGSTVQLTATCRDQYGNIISPPTCWVAWSYASNDISVSAYGLVTGIAPGTAIATALATDGSSIRGTSTINVVSPTITPPPSTITPPPSTITPPPSTMPSTITPPPSTITPPPSTITPPPSTITPPPPTITPTPTPVIILPSKAEGFWAAVAVFGLGTIVYLGRKRNR